MNSDDLRATLIKYLEQVKMWPSSSHQYWADYVLTDKEYRSHVSPGVDCVELARESRKSSTSDDIHVLFWTNEYEYHITVARGEVSDGWLKAAVIPRKSRPGQRPDIKEIWESSFSEGCWSLLMDQILGYEIVAKPREKSSLRPNTSQLTRTYTSFTGADIRAVFQGVVIGELVGVSYTVTREIKPSYNSEGGAPAGFSKGKQRITGTLSFQKIDVEAIKNLVGDGETLCDVPFDVTITYADRMGQVVLERLVGVQILEGEGIRIDNITHETNCTFVCRKVEGMVPDSGKNAISQSKSSTRAEGLQSAPAKNDHPMPYITATCNGKVLGNLVSVTYTIVHGDNSGIAGTLIADDDQWVKIKQAIAKLRGSDELVGESYPPFPLDITFLSPQNVWRRLHDIQVVNQSSGVSVDDLTSEVTCVFTCERIEETLATE